MSNLTNLLAYYFEGIFREFKFNQMNFSIWTLIEIISKTRISEQMKIEGQKVDSICQNRTDREDYAK